LTNGDPNGIRINADSAMPSGEDLLYYKLTATILFKSGASRTTTSNIIVSDDSSPIVMSSQSFMYNVINTAWTTQYGSDIGRNNFYKVDLASLTGTLDFTPVKNDIANLLTANGSYLLRYLPNLTGLTLDDCDNITNVSNSISQLDFTYMAGLRNLSIQGCAGITGNIDISACTDVRQVDVRNTAINIVLPQATKITDYKITSPTSINIENPTSLALSGVTIDSYKNLDSLIIRNMTNNKSYALFNEITRGYSYPEGLNLVRGMASYGGHPGSTYGITSNSFTAGPWSMTAGQKITVFTDTYCSNKFRLYVEAMHGNTLLT
jgi:hypothetical protein